MNRFLRLLALVCFGAALCCAQTSYANGSLTVEGTINYCGSDNGSGSTFACQNSSGTTISTYITGSFYSFQATHSNSGASTLAIDSGATVYIRKQGGTADLAIADIVPGQIVQVQYDGSYFEMQSPVANAPSGGGGGGASSGANNLESIRRVTANDTATTSDGTVLIDLTSGSVTETLPAAPSNGQVITVKRVTNATNNVATVTAGSGKTIEGQASLNVAYDTAMRLQYETAKSTWWVI